ncbi:SpaA isopeptide-forming pilin-related protein [Bifidobacterium rousetti]|uniref:SpaA isopeptide-forming pilin-related protein n=1 Tax=Bifidobacterium rousetti TaxID=2045439 RepID=UPI00168BF5CA|nr:SpaA isopeptide-forming pilin-related protein [Bifidobacterium rousetti]
MAAIAIGATCISAAFPAFAAQGIAGTLTDTGTQSSSNVKTDGQPNSTDQGDSSITDDSTVSGSNADSQSDAGSTSTAPKAEAEGQDSCGNVLTWTKLSECVSGNTPQTVTIAQAITVPDTAKDPIIINTKITLTAKSGVDPALTSPNNGDTIFNVAPGALLTIGTDKHDANFSYKDGKRFLVYLQNGGNLIVNNGTFSGIDTTGSTDHDMGTLAYSAGGTVTINNGTFENNKASRGGVVYGDQGTVTVNGGTFTGNEATGEGGGVMYGLASMMTVNGGTFTGNESSSTGSDRVGGGAIRLSAKGDSRQTAGKLDVTGGVFEKNIVKASEGNYIGGGAVWAQGDVTISGGVFAGNYAAGHVNGWSGGGALYISSGSGSGPTGYYSTLIVSKGTFLGNATHGGGGAIFLGWNGTAIFTGISGQNASKYGDVTPSTPIWFQDNYAEHLGGAVYTEEATTTYMGKAVAYKNGAGHFGGGLWLCPSGKGFNSKGGNMLLFDNEVDARYDVSVNEDGSRPQIAQQTGYGQSGKDFAIMPPTKANVTNNSFELSDEDWAGDQGAITWSADEQQPGQSSHGYGRGGLSVVPLSKTRNSKYNSKKADGTVQWTGTTSIEQTQDADGKPTAPGVGLTSTLSADMQATARANALVTFTENHASLSGGGFGTDGTVMFSTPFTMSWSKAKASEADGKVTVDTNAQRLAGSKWKLSTVDGGPMEVNMRPVECMPGAAKNVSDSCWHNLENPTADNPMWVIIEDNGSRDNDRTEGDISINNLKAGTYTLTEESAPDNYQQTHNTYTFTVDPPAAGSKYEEPKLTLLKDSTDDGKGPLDTTGKVIGNLPDTGSVSWSKIDAKDTTAYLPGSEWKIMNADGTQTLVGYENIADNTGAADYQGKDENLSQGRFTVTGLPRNASYQLCETQVPTGYQKPAEACHKFTISSLGVVTWDGNNADAQGRIQNTPTQVTWTKIDGSESSKLLPGSEWSVVQCDDESCAQVKEDTRHSVVDCATSNCTVPSDAQQYKDVDNRGPGYITIRNLPVASYKLTETKAPEGYLLPDADTTYAVITIAESGTVTMTLHGEWSNTPGNTNSSCTASESDSAAETKVANTGCALPNVKSVSALPFTGGRSGLDWLLLGGGIALAAALAALATGRVKRHEL